MTAYTHVYTHAYTYVLYTCLDTCLYGYSYASLLWEEWDLNDSLEFVSQVRGGKSFRPATTESPTQVPTQTPTW